MNEHNARQWYPLCMTGPDWRCSPSGMPPGQVCFLPRGRQGGRPLTTTFIWFSFSTFMDTPRPPVPTKNSPLESQNLLVGTR